MSHNIEALEARRMLSTIPFVVTSKGTLVVQGSIGDDTISVTQTKNAFVVSMNSLQGFRLNHVKRVRIEGAAGNDTISFSEAFPIPATILGGRGNDRLVGAGPSVILSGGPGDDHLVVKGHFGMALFGGRGNDLLNGSSGKDLYYGGAGDDYAATVTGGDTVDSSVERQLATD